MQTGSKRYLRFCTALTSFFVAFVRPNYIYKAHILAFRSMR